jgi:two-component system response regulator RegX3
MAADRRTILLVDAEPGIAEPLAAALRREGYETTVVGTASDARLAAGRIGPDLILLDIGLPDGSGFDLCRELRGGPEAMPVIMITARGEEADRVSGLELGADDYVVKPFSAREVAARVRAVLRRTGGRAEASGRIEIGEVVLDEARHEASLRGERLELSRKEFELLRTLMRSAGTVLTRERLIEEVWDMNWFGSTKTLDVHVSAVRKKLGDDPRAPRYIHTIRGVGFRFAGPEER